MEQALAFALALTSQRDEQHLCHWWSSTLNASFQPKGLLLGMLDKKLRIEYFPISWREDDQVSNVKMTSQALQTLHLLWQSLSEKKQFWSRDHRAVRHQAYEFDVVYKS